MNQEDELNLRADSPEQKEKEMERLASSGEQEKIEHAREEFRKRNARLIEGNQEGSDDALDDVFKPAE